MEGKHSWRSWIKAQAHSTQAAAAKRALHAVAGGWSYPRSDRHGRQGVAGFDRLVSSMFKSANVLQLRDTAAPPCDAAHR